MGIMKSEATFRAGDPKTIAASRKGAEATRKRWAQIKELQRAAIALRDMPCPDKPSVSNGVALVAAMYKKAIKGDTQAANFLANLMGEFSKKIDVKNIPILRDDIPRSCL